MTENEKKWHVRFICLAHHVAQWSYDPSTKCGSVIIRPNRTIASVGYNGFPRGCDDDPKFYKDRPLKYMRILHGEVNAILNCAERPEGFTLYSWPPGYGPSCARCSAVIIQSGIKRVVFVKKQQIEAEEFASRWKTEAEVGMDMFKEAGVEIVELPAHWFVEEMLGSSSKG